MSNSTTAQMSQPAEQHSTDHKNAIKGTEVYVGGLPRSISEEKIREVFSPCGEIVEIRMIKDRKGNLKGFCFVRFASKEAAARAMREKSGTVLDGKKINVFPSSEQDTLYFGHLNKAWSADEFERMVRQVFPDIKGVDLAMLKDVPPGQKQHNRGFAFVKFSSHSAAARAQKVGSQPDFRLGNLHPCVNWAEDKAEIDPEELAKIKEAFVRNLPVDAEENYLKQLFEPFGKVEKAVVLKKGGSSVGFVHFTERSDLERAVKEMNTKTVQGPNGGPAHILQVDVARPGVRKKKRTRENSESNSSVQGRPKILKEENSVALSNNHNSQVQRELEPADPYEDAVIALPIAIKERLLRILRLGIATRFDIDIKSLHSLKELPESISISVLDQFMFSGAALQNKGAYLAGLISRHLVDKVVSSPRLVGLPKVADTTRNESDLLSISHRVSPLAVGSFTSHAHSTPARSDIYAPYHPSLISGHPTPSPMLPSPDPLLSNRSVSGPHSIQIPRIGTLEARSRSSPFQTPISYDRIGLRNEDFHLAPVQAAPSLSASYTRPGISLSSDITPVAGLPPSRSQVRFDPFTGEPYKFDPFTGEPIHPVNTTRRY